jgi:hypothetical protein
MHEPLIRKEETAYLIPADADFAPYHARPGSVIYCKDICYLAEITQAREWYEPIEDEL